MVDVKNNSSIEEQEGMAPEADSYSSALDALFLLNPQIMWVYDRDTLRFMEVNDAAIAHYGYTRDEFLSLRILDIRPQEEIPRLMERLAILDDNHFLTGEWQHRTKDGRIIHVEVSTRAIPFAGKRAALTAVNDITARKEAEQEQERLLSELRYITHASRCLFWHADVRDWGDGKGLRWQITSPPQENAERLFPIAMQPTDNFYRAWYRSRLEEDRLATYASAEQQIRSGKSFTVEYRFRTKDNEIRWASEEVSVEVVEPDRAWRVVSVATDITQRKNAEETLRYMMDSAQCLLWYADIEQADETGIMDWDLRIPAETTAAQQFLPLEVPSGSSYAQAWEHSRHPDDSDRMNAWGQIQVELNQGYSQEFRCFDKYGKMHWLKEDVHVEPVGPGRWRAAGVCTDITPFKESEYARICAVEAQAASEQRYRSVVERVRDVIFETNADGRCVFLNAAWQEITGYDVAESMGRSLTNIMLPEHQAEYENLLATLKNGSRLQGPREFACYAKDGQTIWLEVSGQSTYDSEGQFSGVLGTIRDITEQKRMQAQLMRTEKLAALGELAAGVAHEINNPLSVASAMAQFLEMHSDPDVQGDANTIHRMIERITRIIHSLRIFAHDGPRNSKRPVPVSTIVENAMNIVGNKLRQAEIEVERDLPTHLPEAMVNEGEIEQVMVNLLMNAEYALRSVVPEARQIHISAHREMTYTADSEEEWLCIIVRDNGCGMSDAVKARIFDPFFTTKDIGEGTGLGLSICHGIIQGHGGSLTVESEIGKGTTFTIFLRTWIPPQESSE